MLKLYKAFALSAICVLFVNLSLGQANIQVRVVSVQVQNSVDCDGFLSGNSDFAFEYAATDNTVGYSNNNPAAFGLTGDFNFSFQNNNNGPWTLNPGSIFFDHDYYCTNDVPTQINIEWQGYENDDLIFNWDLTGAFSQVRTGVQSVSIPVPGGAGSTGNVTFNASGSSGCGTQNYVITFEVIRTDLAGILVMADNVCDASNIVLNTTYNFAYCTINSLEPNEPRGGDVAGNNASAWIKFTAPASGSVEITTDLAGTEIGTYFQLYHAADGNACGNGVQPITGTLIKDKFEYLSHIEFSDGIDALGLDPEAELSFDSCDPIPLISYTKLIAGQTYYVQVTSDGPSESGLIQVRVNDLGGSSASFDDIPCTSSNILIGNTFISNENGDGPSVTLGFGCAFDGGNDAGETGTPHTNNDPENYHAYDYDHPGFNNNTMNESVWFNFTSPNSGRIVFEADYDDAVYGENNALFGFDKRFAPGIPTDYSCANLEFMDAASGDANNLLTSAPSAVITAACLEPGYNYYGMIDPSDLITPLSPQTTYGWVHDPSVADPTPNPPGNDILCLTMLDPLYEIPVVPAGTNPQFQAVAGNNEFGCTEYLAGEPPANSDPTLRADQTVWHYFTVPPSGAIEMNLRAYIGMDTLRYAVYELLNGTDCYGGLNPATFTEDGTQTTPIITSVLSGSAPFEGTQESLCCLTPGTMYAIQLDGGYPGDEGQYIIEYIREIESYSGDTYVELANATIIDLNSSDTAFVCFGDAIVPGNLLDGNGDPTLDIPSCLTPGFVMHSTTPIPDPVTGSGFTYLDTVQGLSGVFINDTDGSGSFGNPLFNTVYYVSSAADEPVTWGDFTCPSSTLDNQVQVLFLQPIVPFSLYDNSLCEITFSATGGLTNLYGGDFTYTIEDGAMNLVETGTFTSGTNVLWPVPSADVFTISVNDGACPYTFTVDATACANPCITTPIQNFVNTTICQGDSLFLEGAWQTTAGLYTDVFVATNGCDSTVYTTVDLNQPSLFEQTITICQGTTFTAGTSTYNTSGVYVDTLVAANGCDSLITTNLFVENILTSSLQETLCFGDTYTFGTNVLTTSGTYIDTLSSVGGCDSVVTLYLNIEQEIESSMSATICSGQTYTIGTQTLTTSGTYQELFTAANGCDSLVTLYLFVNPAIENNIGVTICQGQSYTFGAQTLTASGEYTDFYTTASGCDSLVRLFLTVTEATDTNYVDQICEGDTLYLGTQVITNAGIYTEVFTTAAGCDSVVTVDLAVGDCNLEIANICTPNGDMVNDTWLVSDLEQIAGCDVNIYNRWGQLLYETNDYQNDWNGTKGGTILPDGVYYYAISCDGEKMYQGAINLLRLKK